ncbi:MAG TPA: hemolysin family protein [Verrucomicrobiae bacterium]|jgi:CBS domain containing-hemolysin-like protein|nr:hemolysin family protein [Verrucomicrobiae bacterium]
MSGAVIVALKILAVVVLVLLNGFFVAAEFALVRIRETQLDTLAAKNQFNARTARRIVRNLNAYLSATQLGITMASLGLGWLGQSVFAKLFSAPIEMLGIRSPTLVDSLSFLLGFVLLTFFHITAGELAPKWLTIQKPLPVALWAAVPLRCFYLALYPFNRLLNLAARFLLREIGIEPDTLPDRGQSEEELRLMLATAHGAARGRNIALNALDLRQRAVREIMRPRQEVASLDTSASLAECLGLIEKTRYSRFPICEDGDLDRIRGVIHFKDVYAQRERAKTGMDLLPWARRAIYVPETAQLERLLQLFLERKFHFAVVVDEYGGTLGIVTLENLLETLVGQIQDEFDQEKAELLQINENAWETAGSLPLPELEKITGPVEHGDGVATASGWVTEKLGGFPKAGDAVTVGNFELRVEEMDGARVGRLKIIKREDTSHDTEFKV